MKRCLSILLSLIFVTCFSACSNEKEQNLVQCEWSYCGKIYMPIDEIKIYYDTKTKVMYAKGLYSITVLFNADGTPMLYEREDGKLKTAGKGR